MGKGIIPSTATIVELMEKGQSMRSIARMYHVSYSAIWARGAAWYAQQKEFRRRDTEDKITRTIKAAREDKTSYGKVRARETIVTVVVPEGYMTAAERERAR